MLKKSKKILATGMLIAFSMTSGLAFAEEAQENNDGINRRQQVREQIETRVHEAKENGTFSKLNEDFKAQFQEMKVNREEIRELRQTLKEEIKLVRDKIKEMKKNPESITEEEIQAIRESMQVIKIGIKELRATDGAIIKEAKQLREKRRMRDGEGCKASIDEIISIQEGRIVSLQTAIEGIEKLLDDLE